MLLSLQAFAFEGQNMMLTVKLISWHRARLWLELFASTGRFLSWLSYLTYLPLYIFLQRRCSFTSRKLYACLEKFLCFLQLSDWAYHSTFLELDVVCWLCCVLYVPLFGLSSKLPGIIFIFMSKAKCPLGNISVIIYHLIDVCTSLAQSVFPAHWCDDH